MPEKLNQETNHQPDLDECQQSLAAAQQQAEEYLNGWKRAKADYLNLKRETEQRQAELFSLATAGLLVELLPVYDNLKTAWQHVPESERTAEWVVGFEHIKNQLGELLKHAGIETMKTVGEPFNPDYHEAVAHEPKPGVAPDSIFEETAAGYLLHGKVLRVAKVKVAQ